MKKKELISALMDFFHSKPDEVLSLKYIFEQLHLTTHPLKMLCKDILSDMLLDDYITEVEKSKYKLNNHGVEMTGTFQRKSNGKNSFIPEGGGDPIFVAERNSAHAMNNDKVRISFYAKRRGCEAEGEVIEVLERANDTFVGTLEVGSSYAFLVTENRTLANDIFIPKEKLKGGKTGDKAIVKVIEWPDKAKNPIGQVIDILGKAGDNTTEMHAILAEFGLPYVYPSSVEKAADKIPAEISDEEIAKREDFRNVTTFTIDPKDAKDFDDAISIEKTQQGYRLYVHIADVSHYVKEGSPIDQEAFARSTSIYVADRVVPMLPFALSNGICSLNPHVDRCTLSCVMDIDFSGRCLHHEIVPSLIHSNQRCTYAKVNRFLQGDEQAQKEYEEIQELLYAFEACAKLLQARSHDRGTIDFNTKEPKLVLDEEGKCIDVQCRERGFAEQMIEEAMILANVCVAHTLNTCEIPGIYRVHETPDPKKVSHLTMLAHSLGIRTSFYPDSVTTKDMQQFLESIQDPALCDVLSYVALRAMQKARYDANCLGHFGLSLSEYCHFTSPIRRYADLVVHRMLRKYLFLQNKQDKNTDLAKCERQAFYISGKEKDAVNVERQVNDYKRAEYMEDKIGQIFKGNIVSVHNFGFFVELPNTVEGLVPIHSLDDYFDFDEVASRLISQDRKKVYTIGQKVKVVCESVDKLKGQVSFVLK